MRADRLKNGCVRHLIHPDGAESSKLSIRRHGDDIEVAVIKWNFLDILIPFPALILFVRLIWMEDFPREPAARRQFTFVTQGADDVSALGNRIRNRLGKEPP